MKIHFKIKHHPDSNSFRYVYGSRFLLFYHDCKYKQHFKFGLEGITEEFGDTRSIPENAKFFSRMKIK